MHQQQARYADPASSAVYEHQQRMIQQQHQQVAHRERQMATHRGLGVQPNQHTVMQQMPARQMSGAAVRPVRGQAAAAQGWPHPTLPGQRITEQHMQQYQQQHQQAAYAQQQQQQQMIQVPAGYRLATGPATQVGNGPTQLQLSQTQSIQQAHIQNTNLASTPSRPPLSHSLSYLETNNIASAVPVGPISNSAPNSAHPNQIQSQRAPSRQAMRSVSPMPPPSLPIPSQTGMQASTSASALQTSTSQPASLPIRSSTLPLTSAPLPPIRPATAGSSSMAPPQISLSPIRRDQESDPPDNPQRMALRENLSTRLKKHIERTEKQLLAAEKLEKSLKKKAVGRKSCKEMGKDEGWRGKFDDLVLEYLEKAGYENAVSGLRLDKDKVTAGSSAIDDRMAMEDSAMSELPEEGGTGKTTLVELEAEGQSGTGAGKSNKADSIHADPDQGQSEASKRLGRTRETGAQTVSQGEGDLGKLFMWYTVQRFSRQILSTLQSSAIREFRIVANLSTTPTTEPKERDQPPSGLGIDPSHPAGASPAPPTAQVPSSATAAKIVISASQAAVRAASVSADPNQSTEMTSNLVQSIAGPSQQQSQVSPTELIGLTATLQQADVMRAAQEAQIQAKQAATKAAVEANRAMGGGPLTIQNPADRIAVQIGDQIVYMAREEYLHRQAEQNWMTHQHQLQQQQQRGMVQHVMPIQQGPQVMMVPVPIQQQSGDVDRGYTSGPGVMKRVLEGEVDEVKKKAKIGRQPTPEDHHRQAIEMANKAKAMGILYPGGAGGVPSIQGSRPDMLKQGARPIDWTRQVPVNYQAFGTGATPSTGTYDDHATPQASDALSGRIGMVPSPTASRTSHKKKPSVLGLEGASGMTDGEPTPTSAKKKGGRKGPKGSVKKKGKQGTPTSADGPVTPFGMPQTPVNNISHTPSHPPGEFQPSPPAESSHDGYQSQQPSVPVPVQGQLQVQLGQHQSQQYQQNLQQYQQNNPNASNEGINGSNPFDGMHMSEEDIIKALNGHMPASGEPAVEGAAPQSAGPSATGFDGMGFDLNDPGTLNFDWDSMNFGDTWGDYPRNDG